MQNATANLRMASTSRVLQKDVSFLLERESSMHVLITGAHGQLGTSSPVFESGVSDWPNQRFLLNQMLIILTQTS